MKYFCTWCNYFYNEDSWDLEEGIDSFSRFDNLDESFCCPFCWTSKEDFVNFKEEIIYIENPNFMNFLESSHYPIMEIRWDKIFLEIWNIKHPFDDKHYIKKVCIYDDTWDLIEEKILWPNIEPTLEFNLDYIDDFEIRIFCNIDWVFSTGILKNNW